MRIPCSIVALVTALSLGACTPPPRAAADVGITFNADPGKLPFDPYGVRLRGAREKLAEVVGRKVALELDVALVREYRPWFETGLVTAVENAAHDLGELKRTRSEAWTAMFSKLGALSLRYDTAAHKVGVRLEAERETLQVTVPPASTSFLPHEAALLALEAQYDAGLPERYAAGVPATVSVAEKRAYFRALTGQKPPPLKPDDPATARGIANDVRPTAIARATRFYDVAMPQDLKAEIHEWLLTEGNYFRDGYLLYPEVVKAAPPTSAFHRAEAAWVDWTQKNADRFTDLERTAVAKLVYVRAPTKERGAGSRYLSFAFPGFDRLSFGLGVLEEWAGMGHHTVIPGRERLLELFEFIVCPFEPGARGERSAPAGCERDFYRLTAETEAAAEAAPGFLAQEKDEVLAETAVGNFMRMGDMRTALYLWRGLEADEASWKAATRIIAEELGDTETSRLQDEALRLWQAYPARRGSLLYLLSQIDRYGNDRVAWGAWGEAGKGRASAPDFAAFWHTGGARSRRRGSSGRCSRAAFREPTPSCPISMGTSTIPRCASTIRKIRSSRFSKSSIGCARRRTSPISRKCTPTWRSASARRRPTKKPSPGSCKIRHAGGANRMRAPSSRWRPSTLRRARAARSPFPARRLRERDLATLRRTARGAAAERA